MYKNNLENDKNNHLTMIFRLQKDEFTPFKYLLIHHIGVLRELPSRSGYHQYTWYGAISKIESKIGKWCEKSMSSPAIESCLKFEHKAPVLLKIDC